MKSGKETANKETAGKQAASKDTNTQGQRDALAQAEKKAAEQQPKSYDERNNTDKKVRVEPTDPKSSKAIKGLDPK